jgi:branched-chain amino acid aminotransferase
MSDIETPDVQLFAVTAVGPQPLPVPPDARSFDDLYAGLSLGVYSALRTFNHHQFLYLDVHIERTSQSMTLLGWDYQLDETALRHALHAVCTAYHRPEARVRFDVLAEPAHSLGTDSRVLIALMPFTPPTPEMMANGVVVDVARDLARERPLAKTAQFAIARRRYPMGQAAAYEYLLLDEQGAILEGTGTNFYGVRNGIVYTAGEGVLEGVTRRIVFSLLDELAIPLRLEAVSLADVASLDEAFLTGSSRAVLPVVQIAGQPVGNGRPGPVGLRLLMAYNQFVAKTIRPAIAETDQS